MSYNPLVKINHKTKVIGKLKVHSNFPIYSLFRSTSSTNEGTTVTFTLSTLNVADGTTVPYSLGGITLEDLTDGSLTGSFIVSSGTASQSFTIANDATLEGNETMSLTAAGKVAEIQIFDTSLPFESPAPPVVPIPPDYTLTRSASVIDEGQSITYTLSSPSFQYGDIIPYVVTGNGITEEDFVQGSLQGNFVVGYDNIAEVTFVVNEDYFTEGVNGEVMLLSALGGFTDPVTINDTSLSPVYQSNAPTYSLTRLGPDTINELDTVTFFLSTTNVPDGTLVPYSIKSAVVTTKGITQEDFFYWWEPLVSDFVVYNNQASVTYDISGDSLLEGTEYLTLMLTNKNKSATVKIRDTSWTPLPVYTLTASASATDEGTTITYTLSTDRGADGTLIPYNILSPYKYYYYVNTVNGRELRYINAVNSADLSMGSLTGNFVLSGHTATASFTLANDQKKEGLEYMTLRSSVGKSVTVRINDTSLNPVYVLSRSSASVAEGSTVTYTLSTLRVDEGAEVPYTVYGTGISAADFSDGSMNGVFVIDANGMASTSFTIANDALTETETMTLSAGDKTLATPILDVTYTLNRSLASISEGDVVTYTLTTTNVANGTQVPYTITGIDQADLSAGDLTGVFTVINNTASAALVLANDWHTEGTETITIVADTNSGTRTQTTTVVDTSLTPDYVLLLTGDGPDGGNNIDFIDTSSNNLTITKSNSPIQSSETPVVGGSSVYFDSTKSQFLTIPINPALAFLTYDFTIEGWFNTSKSNVLQDIFANIDNIAGERTGWNGGNIFRLLITPGNLLEIGIGDDSPNCFIIHQTIINPNTWYHFAVVRSSGYVQLYVNGVSSNTASKLKSDSLRNRSAIYIGVAPSVPNLTTRYYFTGYMSDLRILNGVAAYTGNFDIPAAPLASTANTAFLLKNNPHAIFDATGNNPIIESFGNAQITTANKAYGTGSLKFDGTGDYLKIPASADLKLGVYDFTIEFWCNFTDASLNTANRRIYCNGINASNRIQIYTDATTSYGNVIGGINLYTLSSISKTKMAVNDGNWHHIAFTRQNGTIRCFVDGVLKDTTNNINTDFGDTTTSHYIGVYGDATTGFYNGLLDDFRITKGTALYTADFTPPQQGLLAY